MNVLVLGGMSPRHKEWVRQVASVLKPHFNEVRLLDYRHWDQEGAEMNLEYEITQTTMLAQDLGDYVVVAKSIGTVVAILANSRDLISPARCVFMGFPLKVVLATIPEVADALPKLPVDTTFLHNDHDPLGAAEDISAYISEHMPQAPVFMTMPGGTHDYIDFDLITRLTSKT